MIGELPKTICVNGIERAIRSDFRVALSIFQALNDVELKNDEKIIVLLDSLYEDFKCIETNEYEEALKKAIEFLDGGKEYRDNTSVSKKLIDWEQDEQIIFSAVNKVASKEVRELGYLHWWSFLGYFSEIGECLFSTVINIRSKKNKGKKLEKYEVDFYKANKDLIDLKQKYTEQEKAEIDRLSALFK